MLLTLLENSVTNGVPKGHGLWGPMLDPEGTGRGRHVVAMWVGSTVAVSAGHFATPTRIVNLWFSAHTFLSKSRLHYQDLDCKGAVRVSYGNNPLSTFLSACFRFHLVS